ncbi:hypothetical protein D3C71_2128130 [compost metagenome]
MNGLEHGLANHRLHDVQLQLARFGRHGNASVVANHLETHLIDHFRYDRVDLGRHDGRARLHFRQVNFVQTGAWA